MKRDYDWNIDPIGHRFGAKSSEAEGVSDVFNWAEPQGNGKRWTKP